MNREKILAALELVTLLDVGDASCTLNSSSYGGTSLMIHGETEKHGRFVEVLGEPKRDPGSQYDVAEFPPKDGVSVRVMNWPWPKCDSCGHVPAVKK
jgi:hypothetical protein